MSTAIVNELKFSNARDLKNLDYPKEWKAYLNKNKYYQLDHGVFSEIYGSSNSNIIVKIGTDKAWLQFYEFAYRNQRKSKHLPRVGKLVKHDEGDGTFMVFMEKLAPANLPSDAVKYLDMVFDQDSMDVHDPKLKKFAIKFFGREFLAFMSYLLHNKNKFWWDLHDTNIMRRPKDDALVIIDPYADPDSKKWD